MLDDLRRSRSGFAACALALAALMGTARDAHADTLVLKNQDTLTGTVAAVSKTELTLQTELAGRVTVKWPAVSSLRTGITVRVTQADGHAIDGVLAVSGGRVQIRPASGAAAAIDLSTIRGLDLAAAANAVAWHETLDAGVDVSRGNSATQRVATNGTLTRQGRSDRLGVFGAYDFSSVGSGADGVTTERNSRGGIRYDHDVTRGTFGFGFTDVENDPLQLLDLRTVFGGGAGTHLVRSDTTQFNLVGGVSYARDSYTQPPTTGDSTTSTSNATNNSAAADANASGKVPPGLTRRSGAPPSETRTTLSRNVGEWFVGQDWFQQLPGNVSANERLAVYPAVGDANDYRVSFDLSLTAQINGWLHWETTIADRYLHIPPAGGAVQNDTFVSTGLGITFGNGALGAYTGSDGRPSSRSLGR